MYINLKMCSCFCQITLINDYTNFNFETAITNTKYKFTPKLQMNLQRTLTIMISNEVRADSDIDNLTTRAALLTKYSLTNHSPCVCVNSEQTHACSSLN